MKYLFTKGVSRMSIDEIIKSAAKDLSVNRCACEAIRSDSCTLPNREVIIQVLEDLQNAKLERVKSLLRETSTPIDAIGPMCDFRSIAHLKTLFKKKFGMTMSQYRFSCE
jgi:AraC-like DNA-binding protein